MRECGSVGVRECGSVGVWECGCVVVWWWGRVDLITGLFNLRSYYGGKVWFFCAGQENSLVYRNWQPPGVVDARLQKQSGT